ncbi:MAG: hypothetical protein WCA17_15825 [Burkholderiales bacterium]
MKLARLLALVLPLFTVAAHAEPERGSAVALRQTYAALAVRLAASPFGRPLVLESRQSDGRVQGAVYAVVDHAFDELKSALDGTRQWCEVLILHLNVKDCRSTPGGGLAVFLGRKTPQPPEQAQRLDFEYRTAALAADFMEAVLQAESGPAGTRDYRIRLEAAPLDAKRSFVALSYSYAYGLAARIAVNAYLATAGSGKVGFTVLGKQPDKGLEYVGGLRGIVERNVMRYYLAVEARLDALSAPPEQRPERSMRNWFAATERYPRQLHEIDRSEYLEMKRVEIRRDALALRIERPR